MKSLKIDHRYAAEIVNGTVSVTWRINDDKDLHVNDDVSIIDKIEPTDPKTWKVLGTARIVSIIEKQLGAIASDDMEGEQKFASAKEAIKQYRLFYGPQIDEQTPVKIIRFTFTPNTTEENFNVKEVSNAANRQKVKLYADGGSRGNPGPSASGFALIDEHDKIIVENGLFLGVTTNNQAEYHALKIGLEEALRRRITHLQVFMDSMLVINQMKGIFKVKNRDLLPVYLSTKQLAEQFTHITFTHVPRELNKIADAMVNEVLDAAEQQKTPS